MRRLSCRLATLPFVASLLLAFPCAHSQQPAAPAHPIVLRAARLIAANDDAVLNNAVVILDGEKIAAVGSGLPIPPNADVIDLGDATLLPGLIDAHTHLLLEMDGASVLQQDIGMLKAVATQTTAERALLGARNAKEDLEAGITTVRDLGNSGVDGDIALRDAISRGWLPGPRILAATRALAAPGGQFGALIPEAQNIIGQEYVILNGPDSARQAVRQALYEGANCIKVIVNGSPANVTLQEMTAVVDEAHANNVKVAAHAIGEKATRIAAEAGVDSIEHAYVISDDTLKMMAQKHIFMVPTDFTLKEVEDMIFGTRQPSAEERTHLETELTQYADGNRDRLQRAIKLGVPISSGSDMYLSVAGKTRGQASLFVLGAYSAEGMSPIQIIHAATRDAAELLGLQDRVGTLEKGKQADIIAVPGNPLTDVTALQRARFVMKEGKIIKNEK